MLSLDGTLVIDTPLTADAVNVPPATLCPALFVTAWLPNPSTAFLVVPACRIVPPFSVNALAPMLIPTVSESAATTVYRNTSVSVPVPLAYSACRVSVSTPSASCGVPVTSTAALNTTDASITSPRSNVSPTSGEAIDNPATTAPRLPSTFRVSSFATASIPKPLNGPRARGHD